MKKSNLSLFIGLAIILIMIPVFLLLIKSRINFEVLEGDGNIIAVEYELETIKQVIISGAFNTVIEQGAGNYMKLQTDSNLLDNISIQKENGLLEIKTKGRIETKKLDLKIVLNNLNHLEIKRGGHLNVKNKFEEEHLYIRIVGGSKAIFEGNFQNININMLGGSELDISGKAKNANILISAGSRLSAESFIIETCSVIASAGSMARIYVSESLDAETSAGSIINYSGNPKIIRESTKSGSKIKKN